MEQISRRTIMRAAAWSVPVIAAAIATPLAVASQPEVAFSWRPSCARPWNEASITITPTSATAIPIGTILSATGSSPVVRAHQTGQTATLFSVKAPLVLSAPINFGEQLMLTRDDRTPTAECMRVVVTVPHGYRVAAGTSVEGVTCQSTC